MKAGVLKQDRIREKNRLDPGFFLHPAAGHHWSVPTRPLAEVATIVRRDRVRDPDPDASVLDDENDNPRLKARTQSGEAAGDRYLQWARKDDVVLYRSNYRNCYVIDRRMLVSYDYWIIRPAPEMVPAFLTMALRSRPLQEDIERRSTGHVRKRISKEELRQLAVPVPPVDRQQELVASFREQLGNPADPNQIRDEIQELQSSLGYRKQASDPRFVLPGEELDDRLDPGYYRTPPYRYDGDWPLVNLGTVVEISSGVRAGTGEEEEAAEAADQPEMRLVRKRHMGTLVIKPAADEEYERPDHRDRIARPGQLVFSRSVTDEVNVALVHESPGVLLTTGFYVMIPDTDRIRPMYLGGLLLTDAVSHRIRRRASGRTRRRVISIENLEELSIPLPPVDTQEKLTDRTEDLYRRITQDRSRSRLEDRVVAGMLKENIPAS